MHGFLCRNLIKGPTGLLIPHLIKCIARIAFLYNGEADFEAALCIAEHLTHVSDNSHFGFSAKVFVVVVVVVLGL